MDDQLSYEESSPAAALRPWIRSYYLLESRPGAGGWLEGRMVPDGHLELSFNLGGERLDRTRESWRSRPRACVDEVFDRARLIRWRAPVRHVAVKFRLEAGLRLLALDPVDVGSEPLELATLSLAGLAALEDEVRSARSWERITALLDAFFLSLLSRAAPEPLVARAGALLMSSSGAAPIGVVAEALDVSRRTLELRVKARTGLTPKRLAQCLRTREAIRRVCAAPQRSMSRLAAGLGYCDQSHFIREFKATTGRPPGRFFGERQFVADFFPSHPAPIARLREGAEGQSHGC